MLSWHLFISSVCFVGLDKWCSPWGPGSDPPVGWDIAGYSGATLQTLVWWIESSGPCFSGNVILPSILVWRGFSFLGHFISTTAQPVSQCLAALQYPLPGPVGESVLVLHKMLRRIAWFLEDREKQLACFSDFRHKYLFKPNLKTATTHSAWIGGQVGWWSFQLKCNRVSCHFKDNQP